jgi:Holliday junction DNA helicase RuvA
MIAALKGVISEKSLQRVVVDVGGVGYLVNVSMQTLADLPAAGEPVQLRCHTHVREDALQIFGFTQALEQQAFELLILVSGIGPKLALTALSGMPVARLLGAIAHGDHAALQRIPGVGKKTAERVVVELKERCAKLNLPEQPGPAAVPPPAGLDAEVVEALINLGYKRKLAETAVARARRDGEAELGPEQLLRASLAAMAEQK